MKALRLDQKKIDHVLWGFLIPFVGMGLVILVSKLVYEGPLYEIMFPAYKSVKREYSTLYSDMYHQYFPFFKAYRQALLSGDSLLHSWDVGLGLDYLGLISYYLASPLYLLSVLIPESWLLGYFTFLIPVKLGLAGLFFSIFLKKISGKNEFSIGVFGSFYGLCAWALGYHWNIMWLDTFTLLPLVALGTIRILKERKFVLYTVTLFLSVFSNYYIGLFTCIFVLLVCICYEICRFAGFKKLFIDIGLMALFSILAIGMTAILSLPTLASLATTESSLGHTIGLDERNIAADSSFLSLLDAMRQVAGNSSGGLIPNFVASEGLPNIYCGIGTNIFAFLYLTCKRVRVRDKISAVVLLLFFNVSFIIKQLDYLWHGTHVPNMIPYRFSFLYSFVLLYMAYRAWSVRRQVRLWQVGIALVLSTALIMLSNDFLDFLEYISSDTFARQWTLLLQGEGDPAELLQNFVFIAYNGVFLLLYTAALLFAFIRPRFPATAEKAEKREYFAELRSRRRIGAMLVLGVFCAEQALNLISFGISFFPGTNVSNYPKGTTDTAAIVQLMEQQEQDNLFYRAETTHTQTLNDGALNGYHGISTFTSSANMSVSTFMRAMGYAALPSWNRYVFEEASPVSNLFLNLKYMIERDGQLEANPYFSEVGQSGNVYLLENNAYLPLGFMTDPALAQLSFENVSNRFLFQNDLLSAATGMELTPWTLVSGDDLSFASREVTLNSTTSGGYVSYTASAKGGSVYYTYRFTKAGFFCIDVNTPKRNSFTLSYEAAGSDYVTLYSESCNLSQMLAVCQVNPGDRVQITVRCPANESGTVSISGAVLNEDVFYQAYDVLSSSTMTVTTFENTLVEGSITCDRDGLLYTSIPHNGNWKVFVDGQEAEVTLIGNAMTGVMLTKGSHTVTFRYENKAFTLGCWVSLGCLAVFLGLWLCVYLLPKYKKGKYAK